MNLFKEVFLETSKIADKCSTLLELENEVRRFDLCPLKKNAKNSVFSDGNSQSKLMVIGEAPGSEEDIQGKPFVGPAGKLLDKMLAAINFDRTNSYITNVVFWRPPGNRQPSEEEVLMCNPFVIKHIKLVDPDVLVLAGAVATQSILKTSIGITKLRGKWVKLKLEKSDKRINTIPILHPAFLLRKPEYKRETWTDLKSIRDKLNKSTINLQK